MPQDFLPGDFLIFQLESAFGLIRVLALDGDEKDRIWRLAAYRDMFMDVESAERAIESGTTLTTELPHVALTNRAFESTQVARLANRPLTDQEKTLLENWGGDVERTVHDRSIRLLLGLR